MWLPLLTGAGGANESADGSADADPKKTVKHDAANKKCIKDTEEKDLKIGEAGEEGDTAFDAEVVDVDDDDLVVRHFVMSNVIRLFTYKLTTCVVYVALHRIT